MQEPLRLLTDLGFNVSLILSFLLLHSWARPLFCRVRRPFQPLLCGALFGAFTILSMCAPVHLGPGIIFDSRAIIAALVGCFFGPISAAVVGVMAVAYRLHLGGDGVAGGVFSIVVGALVGTLFHVWMARARRPVDVPVLLLLGLTCAATGAVSLCFLPSQVVWPMLRALALPMVVGFPIASVILGSLLLLEQRKHEAEHDLAAERELLRAIIDNTTAMIYVKAPDGRYLLLNRAFGELFGVAPEQLQGRSDCDLLPPHEAEALRANDREVLATGAPIAREETVDLEDGPHTYLSLKFPLRDARGAPYALCGISTDITERKRIEEERRQILLRTQEALRVREEFLSVASHELRTPLTSLQLLLQSLVRSASREGGLPGGPERIRARLVRAERQSTRLMTLINELLDLPGLGEEGMCLRVEETDLGEVVREVLERHREHLEAAGCAVHVEAEARVVGCWDRSRIEQVVQNLLNNAAKFGAGKPIDIRLAEELGEACLTVRDHGIGVAPGDRERIFGKFERAVSEHNYGGLGLGLFTARQIAEAHGGSIAVESEVGGGSCFTVKLPRRARADAAAARQEHAPQRAAASSSSPKFVPGPWRHDLRRNQG